MPRPKAKTSRRRKRNPAREARIAEELDEAFAPAPEAPLDNPATDPGPDEDLDDVEGDAAVDLGGEDDEEGDVPDAPEPAALGTGDQPQPPLIPMSDEELRSASHMLAKLVQDLAAMKTLHQGRRSEMKAEREELQQRINAVAGQIRSQGR